MTKKITPHQDTTTTRIDRHVLNRMRNLAFWQERTTKDVMQEACDAYADVAFKEHSKKQGQVYSQMMVEQDFED